jgi:flagellin
MSVINTNVKSLVAQDAIMKNNRALSTAMQRLSTGSRINSAKDDAAGLAISTRMDSQTRGLTMAIKNANDGVSLMQTAEGAMDEVTSILQRMRELAVQSANGTNNDSDRTALNDEVTQLKAEIDRIASTTEFNNQKILDGSFKDKKLQIGNKAYQTMDVAIGSVATKDLGMAGASFDQKTLVSARVTLGTAMAAGDIEINDQKLGEVKSTDDISQIVSNVNRTIDNVKASAFNTVVAKQIGTGVTTDGQLQITVENLGGSGASTTYSINASANLQELVSNINKQAGGQVTADIGSDGKLVLSNTTGAKITVLDATGTAGGYETASGFKSGTESFAGFLKLDSADGNPIRITKGNLGATTPGTATELNKLGFQSVTSMVNNGVDAYTVTSAPLTSAAVGTAWSQADLQINGVQIYNSNIKTDSFQGKLDAINNFSDQTGVIAYASFDQTITVDPAATMSAGATISFNGVEVWTAAAATTYTAANVAASINSKTTTTGITAAVDGNNIRLTGTNLQQLKIATVNGTGGAGAGWMGTIAGTTYSAIRLDSVKNTPISIQLGDNASSAQSVTGFLEQNVGAADFQINNAQLGVGSGASLSGLNISTAKSATSAISTIDNAIEKVSSMRSKLGAMENRLNNTVNNLSNIVTNTQASRSRIQDTDYATETTQLAKAQIISQAATAMLAQANQQPQTVLSLLK